MCAALVSESASNWVDRGEPATPILVRILSHFLDQSLADSSTSLEEHAPILVGMVEADATEVHLVGYLRGMRRDLRLPEADPKYARVVAIAIWHVAKVAQWRDHARRSMSAAAGVAPVVTRPLGEWLADRLLTADEREQHRQASDVASPPQKRDPRA